MSPRNVFIKLHKHVILLFNPAVKPDLRNVFDVQNSLPRPHSQKPRDLSTSEYSSS